jgi:hypothetical protein
MVVCDQSNRGSSPVNVLAIGTSCLAIRPQGWMYRSHCLIDCKRARISVSKRVKLVYRIIEGACRMIQITAIRLVGGTRHEHISELQWRNTTTSSTGSSTRAQLVTWLDGAGNQAIVSDGSRNVFVGVVRPSSGSAYVRTYADGVWTDNLMALPRF